MIKEKLNELIKSAMKEKNRVKILILRDMKTRFSEAEHREKNPVHEFNEQIEYKIIRKMYDERRNNAVEYRNAGREDLEEKELSEALYIHEFLPEEPSYSDVEKSVREVAQGMDHKPEMKDMKFILNEVHKTLPLAQGKVVSQILRTL